MTGPRFLVFGAGAIGSVFAARLAPRFPVAVVARGARFAAIRAAGIRVTGATEAQVHPPAVASPAELGAFRPDFVLVATKSYGVAPAARALEALGGRAVRVSLPNGLGNEEALAASGHPVIGAVNNNGATLLPSGAVFHAGLGEVLLGGFAGAGDDEVARLAGPLHEVGLRARVAADIRGEIWRKALLNAAVNPVTALLGLRSGPLLAEPGRAIVVRRLLGEACRVAAAAGVAWDPETVMADIRRITAATPQNKSSMLQDLEAGRRTEIDAINGAIVGRGEAAGVPTPWNRLMLRLIRRRSPAPDRSAGSRDPNPPP